MFGQGWVFQCRVLSRFEVRGSLILLSDLKEKGLFLLSLLSTFFANFDHFFCPHFLFLFILFSIFLHSFSFQQGFLHWGSGLPDFAKNLIGERASFFYFLFCLLSLLSTFWPLLLSTFSFFIHPFFLIFFIASLFSRASSIEVRGSLILLRNL